MPSEIEQKYENVKNFKPEGGILRYPAFTNFHFFLPYAASHPQSPPGNIIQLNVSNYNDEAWPEPAGMTVDWYVQQALPEPPTFDQAQLTGAATSVEFSGSRDYYLYVYNFVDYGSYFGWKYVETITLGRAKAHRLQVPSPFENGFAAGIAVLFEIVH
jgi:hypothetical protein